MTARIPTDTDYKCEESLRQVLQPRFHGLIKDWMMTAADHEKQGIIRLAEIAEPKLLGRIGRPQTEAQAERALAGPRRRQQFTMSAEDFYTQPMLSPPGATGFVYGGMSASSSSPGLLQGTADPNQAEKDEHARIKKPGGYVVKLTDSVMIQRLKNKQRNTGTFQLFGGSGEWATTHRSQYNLRTIGQMG
mmetsp:Transcript_137170/g.242496  ORF Transcript_137170/g.242496 Transcript_137170/m.242496 type:complete len:190 (+) Transcript_137170:149-718(+)